MSRLLQAARRNRDTLSRLSAVGVIFVTLVIISPSFSNGKNLVNVMRVASLDLIIATGIALCMLVSGIDLSVGATIALTTILFGKFFQLGRTPEEMVFGIAGILALGALIGALNGLLVVYLRLPPFLATYGTQQIVRGLAYLLTAGAVFSNFTDRFRFIGSGQLLEIPMPIVIAAVLLAGVGFMLSRTTLGRAIYAVGSNRRAARYSGINVSRTLILAYTLSGLIAGIAGIAYISRLNAAEPNIGMDFAQKAIAAAAIGGISFKGGRGNVFGVIIGALILTLVTNGMNLLGIHSDWQMGMTGAVIILAVLMDRNTARKKL